MREKMFFPIAFMTLALTTAADTGLTVSADLSKQSFLPGEPITVVVTVTNNAGASVTFYGKSPLEGMRVRTLLKGDDGQAFNCGYGSGGLLVPKAPNEERPRSELLQGQCIELSCVLDLAHCPLSMFKPGRYVVGIDAEMASAHYSEPWVPLASITKPIEISAPQGEDAAYLRDLEKAIASADPKTLKGGTLRSRPLEWGEVLHTTRAKAEAICLQQYPTSTYAAYAACGGMPRILDGDKDKLLRSLETGAYLAPGSVPDDTGKSKDGWQSLGGKDLAAWKAKWIDIALKNHPDIWFADDLRLVAAVDQVALKNYQGGAADLEVLSKQAKPDVAQKAQAILDAMKQKGWIKGK